MNKAFFDSEVEAALDALRKGETILYPTDTVWGLGCDAMNTDAVRAIYNLKQREDTKSLIILVANEREILDYVAAPHPAIFDFIERQQKPTTIIFDGAIGLPDNLVSADGSIAIRVVQDAFCRHLIKRLRKPIVSTSANISGEPTPGSFTQISNAIKEGVHHIVRWRQDEERSLQPSQIIKWKENGDYQIIRP